jgi:hypothetical protein
MKAEGRNGKKNGDYDFCLFVFPMAPLFSFTALLCYTFSLFALRGLLW